MAQSTSTSSHGPDMRVVTNRTREMCWLASDRASRGILCSRQAHTRRRWLEWHAAHGSNVSLTCRHFGISRPTFYRWHRRHQSGHLDSLESRSSRPRRVRRPSWSAEVMLAVQRLRERFPRWGKDKLVVLLRRSGLSASTSMVGRILRSLLARNLIAVPARVISARKRSPMRRPHAMRKPKDYDVARPGDLVQLDTLDIRFGGDMVLKQFTARDVVSRWDVLTLSSRATAASAARALDAVLERMPFAVRAIQVDNGSEFMADFEQACAQLGLHLFVRRHTLPSSTAASSEPTEPTPRSSTSALTPPSPSPPSNPSCALGRTLTTPSVPTKPSASSPPLST